MSGMTRRHYNAISHELFDWYIHAGGDLGIPVERYEDLVYRLGAVFGRLHDNGESSTYSFNMTRWREACGGGDHVKTKEVV